MSSLTQQPPSSLSTPAPSRLSTPPLPPPSKAIPTDFRSSLSAWWNNSSYKEARIAEERLLRRLSMYQPPEPGSPNPKGWFSWSADPNASSTKENIPPSSEVGDRAGEQVVNDENHAVPPVSLPGTSLVATLRNVFIPTPDPSLAPQHPADPHTIATPASSLASSTTSLDSAGKRKSLKVQNPLHGKKGKEGKLTDYINTLEISNPEHGETKEAVVVLHGYAAALGNWESVAQSAESTHRRTFFLDWLGMGLSSRPSPQLLSSPTSASVPARVARAEHFFISSLEAWRKSVGVEKMILVGHSLGGYLASAYTVRYPERVSGLILVSPAGIPRGPEYKRFPTTEEITSAGGMDAIDAAEMEAHGAGPATKAEPVGEAKKWQQDRETSAFRRNMGKCRLISLCQGQEADISLCMGMGTRMVAVHLFAIDGTLGTNDGRQIFRQTIRRTVSEEDVKDLHSYIWNTSVMKGSGEFCITHILAPGAHSRLPIVDRIHKIQVPVTFMYGDNDWMDVEGGKASAEALKKAGNDKTKVHVVPNAGHHLYLDNPEHSNRLLDEAIKAVPVQQ